MTHTNPIEGLPIRVARSFRERLYGVHSWPDWGCTQWALFIPRCRAVHTLALAGPVDLAFLSNEGRIVHIVQALAPNRFAVCRRAWAVLELPGGQGLASEVLAWAPSTWCDWKIEV